jgi:hypothetical protein
MDLIKISNKYIKICNKPTKTNRFEFTLENQMVGDSTFYLVRLNSSTEFAKYYTRTKQIVQFDPLEMKFLEKEFAEFFVQTCMEFETFDYT